MKKHTLYVAYGSNMSIEQMRLRCPTATLIGTGLLRDHRLLFRTHATVEPAKGYEVPVLLWSLDAESERALDRYEGYRADGRGYYRKEFVRVRRDDTGGYPKTMMYVMNDRLLCLPHSSYYQILHDAYQTFGFDMTILETAWLESRGVKQNVAERTHFRRTS